MNPSDKRKTIAIELTPAARRVIEGLREDTGIPNTEGMVRILEWFSSLDRKLRLSILNRDVETQQEMLRLVLMDMAVGDAVGKEIGPIDTMSLEDLVRLQKLVADRIARTALDNQKQLSDRVREQMKKK